MPRRVLMELFIRSRDGGAGLGNGDYAMIVDVRFGPMVNRLARQRVIDCSGLNSTRVFLRLWWHR